VRTMTRVIALPSSTLPSILQAGHP
jgi:hypothetical protein